MRPPSGAQFEPIRHTFGSLVDPEVVLAVISCSPQTAALLIVTGADMTYPYSAARVIAFVQAGDAGPLAAGGGFGCDGPSRLAGR